MTASLTIIPSPTSRPATLTLFLAGDVPGEWRRVQLDGKSTSPITRFPVNRDGGAAVGVRVPSSIVVGSHSVRVTTDSATGAVLATASYVVQAAAPPPPVTPIAVISNVVAIPGPTGVSVAWDVAPASQGQVEYGPTTAYGSLSTRETSYQYAHHVQDFPLPAGTYHFRVRGSAPGQTSDTLSPDGTFAVAATAPPPDPGPVPVPTPTPPPGTAPPGTVMFTIPPTMQSDMQAAIDQFIRDQNNQGHFPGFNIPGVYRHDARTVFGQPDLRAWFGPGVQFKRTVQGQSQRAMFQFADCDRLDWRGSGEVHFLGPSTLADVHGSGYPNEDNYLFEIYSGKGGSISNIKGAYFPSDGAYIARLSDAQAGDDPESWTFTDVDLSFMGRQSFSIISGRKLTFRRCSGTELKLHGWDFEPNRSIDVLEDVLLEDCEWTKFDAGLTSAGRAFAVVVGGGNGVVAKRISIVRQKSDVGVKGGTLYVMGPDNGRHEGVTVTGWRLPAGKTSTGQIARVNGWVQSGNTGISLPASGSVG